MLLSWGEVILSSAAAAEDAPLAAYLTLEVDALAALLTDNAFALESGKILSLQIATQMSGG